MKRSMSAIGTTPCKSAYLQTKGFHECHKKSPVKVVSDPAEDPVIAQAVAELSADTRPATPAVRRGPITRREVLIAPLALLAGLGIGTVIWRQTPAEFMVKDLVAVAKPAGEADTAPALLPDRFKLHVALHDLGPRLVAAGAIDLPRIQINADAEKPLTDEQQALLTASSDAPLEIDWSNAYFLLNLLWALGLTNQNPILTEGAMAAQRWADRGLRIDGRMDVGDSSHRRSSASEPLIR